MVKTTVLLYSLGLKTDFFAFPWKGLHLKCYGIFPNVQLHKRPLPKSVLAAVHAGPPSPSKPQCSPSPIVAVLRRPNLTFGMLLRLGNCTAQLGNCYLGSRPWENGIGKIPYSCLKGLYAS